MAQVSLLDQNDASIWHMLANIMGSQFQSDRGLKQHQQLIEEILHEQPDHQRGHIRSLHRLPPEIIHEIFSSLCAQDLARVSMTCRVLAEHGVDDRLWAGLVNSHLPFPIKSSDPFGSFRRLYVAHAPFWFIPQYKVWFADNEHTGNIVVARYDHRRGVIEAYRVLADRGGHPVFHFWEANPDVIIQAFDPTVRLWLDDPVLLLKDPDPSNPATSVHSCKEELRMHMAAESQHIFSSLLLCSEEDLAGDDAAPETLWPPQTIPSSSRATRHPPRLAMLQPKRLSDTSHAVFRLRRWANFRLLLSPGNNETMITYATLDPSLYTPTPKKPYQGIWVGDYSAHGCEFLLFLQQDPPARPEGVESTSSTQNEEDNAAGGVIQQGSLTAIKLTGDPNVPRGERSFFSDDIGSGGLIRVASEEPFRGARIVRATGHVAGLGFRDSKFPFHDLALVVDSNKILKTGSIGSFTDSQLILISPDCVAHYWKDLGHASYYRRVNFDALIQT